MGKLLTVRDLVIKFYTFDGVIHAINGMFFDLNEGETLAIVGESGSGKSVTMKSLLQLLPSPPAKIESGNAYFYRNGEKVDLLYLSESEINKIRGKDIGFVFQDALSALNPVLSIGRQITESLETHMELDKKEAMERAIELLESVGITGARQRLYAYPHQFSGGMRQRAMIAIAIACSPKIVIADEPTTALDVTIQAQILELFKEIQKKMGMAIIWITHDLGVVARLADRVMVMYAGQPVEVAPVEELYENPIHPYTIGLLEALPKLGEKKKKLTSIEGTPPDMIEEPHFCQFASRCKFANEKCFKDNPPIISVGKEHYVRCFEDIKERIKVQKVKTV